MSICLCQRSRVTNPAFRPTGLVAGGRHGRHKRETFMLEICMSRVLAAFGIGIFLSFAALATPAGAASAMDYLKQGEDTAKVADAYIDAYIALDWDRLEPMVADNATFQDRTAEMLFTSLQKSGKAEIMKGFRENYAGLTKMIFHKTRTLHSGNYAIYEGDLEWGVKYPAGRIVESTTPFIVILKVEDGKVVEHRDWVDYGPFLQAELATRPKPAAK